jgi:hypothetical protein
MSELTLVFAYFSPDTLLPLTSVIASVVGVFLVFGRTLVRMGRGVIRVALGSQARPRVMPRPHFSERPGVLARMDRSRALTRSDRS